MLLSCKVPSDPDQFLGQKFDIFFRFFFLFDENPTFSDVTRLHPIFDSEFTTVDKQELLLCSTVLDNVIQNLTGGAGMVQW